MFRLAAVRDGFSHRIVGRKTSDRCDTSLRFSARPDDHGIDTTSTGQTNRPEVLLRSGGDGATDTDREPARLARPAPGPPSATRHRRRPRPPV